MNNTPPSVDAMDINSSSTKHVSPSPSNPTQQVAPSLAASKVAHFQDSTPISPDGSTTAGPKQLAGVFNGVASKKNTVFIRAMFPLEATPKDLVKVACTQLVEYFKMIQLVDATAVLI